LQTQDPPTQEAFIPQRLPQAPQLLPSLLGLTSQPSDQLLLQLSHGAEQAQLPEEQEELEPQLLPQRPQLAASVFGLTSQPEAHTPSQLR